MLNESYGLLEVLFSHSVWRWNYYIERYGNLSVGEGQWYSIRDKLIESTQDYLRTLLSNPQINISNAICQQIIENDRPKKGYWKKEQGEFYSFSVNIELGDSLYEFKVSNVPKYQDPNQIETALDSALDFLSAALNALLPNLAKGEQGDIRGSHDLMKIADAFLCGLEQSITLEYLYRSANYERVKVGQNAFSWLNRNKFNLELIKKAMLFGLELTTRKIENKEISTGFIFHSEEAEVELNSAAAIRLSPPVPFGCFSDIKALLPTTNGRDIFLSVTDSKITHLFITKAPISEISYDPLPEGKKFQMAPLILSIQGGGRLNFLLGDLKKNKSLLQIVHGKPQFSDLGLIKGTICKFISDNTIERFPRRQFVEWAFSLIPRRSGTTIIIGEFEKESLKKSLVSFVDVFPNKDLFQANSDATKKLLSSCTSPDGAILLNSSGELLFIASILPFSTSAGSDSGSGARHQSAKNFTLDHHCMAITISEDGFITGFKNGQREFRC